MSQLMNTPEAAEYLGFRPNTLEVWRCHGRGPRYCKLGRKVVYKKNDLDSFVTANEVNTLDSYCESSGGGRR
ncbi:helix-turn-helix domain-containing protein [Maridesulfovibrio sp.]|uniref:helix-turn-helix domain-containing protein n=1 Tax=Maridesulfovibrio sp. TaxID=2795000 RepID=UPI003B004D8E